MKFIVKKLEKKSNEWYIADLEDTLGNALASVSINRNNKKGEAFPGFDQIEEGAEVAGEHWVSGTGKNYLFEPKPEGQKGGSNSGMAMKAIEIKKGNIAEAQSRKEEIIAQSQDNNMWMYAKKSACELYYNDRVGSKLDNEEQALAKINEIATSIYLMVPQKPF